MDAIFWGDNFDGVSKEISSFCVIRNNPIIAIKSARVAEFNGKNVGTTKRSIILVDPDIEEANILKSWFRKEGSTTISTPLRKKYSPYFGHQPKKITIAYIYNIDPSDILAFYQVKGTITKVYMDNLYYLSCPSIVDKKKCMKKLIPKNAKTWYFPKCNTEVTDYDYIYLLKIDVQDHTGQLLSTVAFEEAASTILGVNAKDLYLLSEDPDVIKEIVSKALWTDHIFTLSVKTETFRDIPRLKCVIIKEESLQFSTECNNILQEINKISIS